MILKIETNFEDTLIKQWILLFKKLPNSCYNLEPKWCEIWCKYFFNKNRKHHLISVYNSNNQLVGLVPMYLESNKILRLIGSEKNLYDEGSCLYENENVLKIILDYLLNSKYNIDLIALGSNKVFTQSLIRKFFDNNKRFYTEARYVKPFATNAIKLNEVPARDVKRRFKKLEESGYDDVIVEQTGNENDIQNMMSMHISRWKHSVFKAKKGSGLFYKDIILSDVVKLYKLYSKKHNKDLAYFILGINGNEDNVTMMMIVHNIEFNNYSPGKLLIYKFFEKFFNDDNNITKIEKIFDFGRGNEDYKYVFANNDAIMLNINTNNILAKISRTLYKIIKLL